MVHRSAASILAVLSHQALLRRKGRRAMDRLVVHPSRKVHLDAVLGIAAIGLYGSSFLPTGSSFREKFTSRDIG